MRLVCPNCGAQYEVDDKVIPDSGRDVQCSGCGHAWYQRPAGHPDEAEAAPEIPAEEPIGPEEADEGSGEAVKAEDAAVDVEADHAEGVEAEAEEAEEAEDEDAGDDDAPPPPLPERRVVDDGVRDILKQEAEREIAAREREGGHDPEQVETQTELGLDRGQDPDEERRQLARERMARMRGIDLDEDPDDFSMPEPGDEPDTPTARRDLFPDIEEINSTLDSRDAPTGAREPIPASRQRGGFGRGFMLVVLLVLIAVAVYVFAPMITERLPSAEPALATYVETVDKGRLWLEVNMQAMIDKLEEMAAPDTGAASE